jgi:ubiquinone/menaquinone biosynthesis C-methylase UbiE
MRSFEEEIRMSAAQEYPDAQNKSGAYVLEPGGAAEMARLMRQDSLLTQGMGGIFPEKPDLTSVQSVLDLACGPGGWALETAYTYADIEVVGVDINEGMIAYANAQVEVQQRSNVRFQVMDILKPLAFQDASFDLVNARYIVGFMRTEQWPVLMKECLRILRPGGILRFTEFEWGGANKPALKKACAMLSLAMSRAGYTFSSGGYYIISRRAHLKYQQNGSRN